MTRTPDTDFCSELIHENGISYVPADFCRKIELELIKTKLELENERSKNTSDRQVKSGSSAVKAAVVGRNPFEG